MLRAAMLVFNMVVTALNIHEQHYELASVFFCFFLIWLKES